MFLLGCMREVESMREWPPPTWQAMQFSSLRLQRLGAPAAAASNCVPLTSPFLHASPPSAPLTTIQAVWIVRA